MTPKLFAFTVTAGLLTACTGGVRHACRTHEDCREEDGGSRGFCTDRGFCARECEEDRDCPCGSFCADGCGICVRDDCTNAATCFAENRGLRAAQDVLGACRALDCARRAPPEDGGLCDREPETLPMCVQPARPRVVDAGAGQPVAPEDAGLGDGGPTGDAAAGDAEPGDGGREDSGAGEGDGGSTDGGV